MGVSNLRRDYGGGPLRKADMHPDPLRQFELWFQQALESNMVDANAMTLATANGEGEPSARTVLLKGYEDGFIFFTDYSSRKGKDLEENPRASLVFYWADFNRQVRIQGSVTRLDSAASDLYFNARPVKSRLAAFISRQSAVVNSRQELEEQMVEADGKHPDGSIPRPERWGGFRVEATSIEFWQGRPNRLHDRLRYRRQDDDSWILERLAP